MENLKTAIYVRVSTSLQADEGYSIDEQISKLKSYCDIKDWSILVVSKLFWKMEFEECRSIETFS